VCASSCGAVMCGLKKLSTPHGGTTGGSMTAIRGGVCALSCCGACASTCRVGCALLWRCVL
jgi:hypothetical protein